MFKILKIPANICNLQEFNEFKLIVQYKTTEKYTFYIFVKFKDISRSLNLQIKYITLTMYSVFFY